jgi:hypothetical protein
MYLNLLAEHFHATIPAIVIHTDSENSLTRIAKSRNGQHLTFPNETLSPSWDVHQAIQRELRTLSNVSLHHKHCPIAQLNIIADELASTAYNSSTLKNLSPWHLA